MGLPTTGTAAEPSRADRRRQAMLAAAMEVFLRHGYLGATTDEVAARASVSKQTLYKHFPDKQQLFAATVLASTDRVVSGLAQLAADTLDGAKDVRKALRKP